jgi:hypothetical protein
MKTLVLTTPHNSFQIAHAKLDLISSCDELAESNLQNMEEKSYEAVDMRGACSKKSETRNQN